MRPYRKLKIESLIQEELGRLFVRDIETQGALLTIMGVAVASDLQEATVSLGIIPVEKAGEILMIINRRRREFQFKLSRIMNIRPMPQLRFTVHEQESFLNTS